MRWYEGDIAQAVSTSKSKNAVFVVYVEGKDDKSKNLTSHLNDAEVSTKLESDTFVAIKVEAGSVPHTQFEAIYNNVPVPSLFFIGKSGKPIDIVTDSTSSDALTTRINTVIETHTGVPVQTKSAAKQSDAFIRGEQQTEPPVRMQQENKQTEPVCENGACVSAAVPSTSGVHVLAEPAPEKPKADVSAAFLDQEKQQQELSKEEKQQQELSKEEKQQQELSKEEKLDRAKQLVEQKREEKRQQEEEDERKKEIERRRLGQEVQKMQRSQQDQELKNLLEERQRAKNEEKAARDRILAQIAQDKADRATRFAPAQPPAAPAPVSSPATTSAAAAAAATSNSNTTRLQFRLPDGVSQTHKFEASATLAEVRDFLASHVRLPFRHFSLSTTFPRREFTDADLDATMRDLELCPNAVILVLAAHPSGTVSAAGGDGSGGLLSILWLLFTPILSIFGYFRTLIFGAEQPPAPEGSGGTAQPPERNKATGTAGSGQGTDDTESTPSQPQPPTKRKPTDSTVVRRQGNSNIHRLSDRTESDDDNNTWNGNSTQQM